MKTNKITVETSDKITVLLEQEKLENISPVFDNLFNFEKKWSGKEIYHVDLEAKLFFDIVHFYSAEPKIFPVKQYDKNSLKNLVNYYQLDDLAEYIQEVQTAEKKRKDEFKYLKRENVRLEQRASNISKERQCLPPHDPHKLNRCEPLQYMRNYEPYSCRLPRIQHGINDMYRLGPVGNPCIEGDWGPVGNPCIEGWGPTKKACMKENSRFCSHRSNRECSRERYSCNACSFK